MSNYRGRKKKERAFQLENLFSFLAEEYDITRSGSREERVNLFVLKILLE